MSAASGGRGGCPRLRAASQAVNRKDGKQERRAAAPVVKRAAVLLKVTIRTNEAARWDGGTDGTGFRGTAAPAVAFFHAAVTYQLASSRIQLQEKFGTSAL